MNGKGHAYWDIIINAKMTLSNTLTIDGNDSSFVNENKLHEVSPIWIRKGQGQYERILLPGT